MFFFYKCKLHLQHTISESFQFNLKCYKLVAYVMVKISHDELFVYCMTFTYLHDSFSTFVDFPNNYMMS
jgi:hypothetical protein